MQMHACSLALSCRLAQPLETSPHLSRVRNHTLFVVSLPEKRDPTLVDAHSRSLSLCSAALSLLSLSATFSTPEKDADSIPPSRSFSVEQHASMLSRATHLGSFFFSKIRMRCVFQQWTSLGLKLVFLWNLFVTVILDWTRPNRILGKERLIRSDCIEL
jgi:hypothetical protein